MKTIFTILFFFLAATVLFAQTTDEKHVVFLKNKDNNPYSLSNPEAFLTQRAIDRRTRYGISLDNKDLPVTPTYVSQIAATGAQVVYTLKWFNAVVIATDNQTILNTIASLPFVDHIDKVVPKNPQRSAEMQNINSIGGIPPYTIKPSIPSFKPKAGMTFNYGQAYNQVHMIAVDGLHDLGFAGEGMMIAVLDAGFCRVDELTAFDSLFQNNRILGTRDFHLPGNNVYAYDMHDHGTSVLSTMGANLPGEIVGTAPHASYWLVRTEVGEYEALIEEYNWAGGAEFADSLGVDIINSSLGYTTFDNPVYDHTYADMDGNTTPVTRAADLATSRGMLVVNSAGNSGGSSWQYIGAPADGDSVFSIGAVDGAGNYASFSSTGPTYDGRIKPDVTAQGSGTIVVSSWGWIGPGYGTSFSSPVVAGALACLWQSVLPFSAQEVRNAVRSTASNAGTPDNFYGYGIPNMSNARLLLSAPGSRDIPRSDFKVSPNPFKGQPVLLYTGEKSVNARVDILAVSGQLLSSRAFELGSTTSIILRDLEKVPAGLYFIRITSERGQQVIRAVKL